MIEDTSTARNTVNIKAKWRKLTLKSPTVGNAPRALMSNNLVSHTRRGTSASADKRDKDDVQTKCWLSGLWSALIIAILQPGGEPEPRLNYHPISLINVDREISRKVLANRLEQIFPHRIHPNQVDLFGKDSQQSIQLRQIFREFLKDSIPFFFLWYCFSFRYTAKWFVFVLFFPDYFPLQVVIDTEYSSLCCTENPCCLSILYIMVCIC